MAQRGASRGWDPPSVLQVTVEYESRRRAARARTPRVSPLALASLIGVGAVVCTLLLTDGIGLVGGGMRRSAIAVPAAAVVSDPAQPATAVYRVPPGCMRITRTRQTLAGALRRSTDPCWRYGVEATAILHRVGRIWGLALETAGGRACPGVPLPSGVRRDLAACRR
jgi:hypothetical protein